MTSSSSAKHQFQTLDGLRGIAAFSVMLFHRRDWFGGNGFFGHAYLAVDFFFLLSGFVIAHAYERRLGQRGSFWPFVRERAIRLHPMLVLGGFLALAVALIDARSSQTLDMSHAGLTFSASLVPLPAFWTNADSAFPWNIAIWSLFWELVANILYAIAVIRLSDKVLKWSVAALFVVMCLVSVHSGGFQVGYERDPVPFILGFPRVCVFFLLGVLVYRRRRIVTIAVPPVYSVVCAVVLVSTFVVLPLNSAWSVVYDPLIAFGVYPVLLLAAASTAPTSSRLTSLLGNVSYPLYVIHEPALRLVGGALTRLGLSNGHPGWTEATIRFCIVVAIAYALLMLYDEPLRRRLRRLFSRTPGEPGIKRAI